MTGEEHIKVVREDEAIVVEANLCVSKATLQSISEHTKTWSKRSNKYIYIPFQMVLNAALKSGLERQGILVEEVITEKMTKEFIKSLGLEVTNIKEGI